MGEADHICELEVRRTNILYKGGRGNHHERGSGVSLGKVNKGAGVRRSQQAMSAKRWDRERLCLGVCVSRGHQDSNLTHRDPKTSATNAP
jgi:hypothetical protein